MAGSSTPPLSIARAYPVNEDLRRNEFQGGLAELIADVVAIIGGGGRDPYAGGDEVRAPHEHDTRTLFVDRLLELLGWRLGAHGNVREEARIRAETVRFMDYVGIVEETQAPLMILEAKAWDRPYVTAREPGGRETDVDLLVAAICHLLDGKSHEQSPVTKVWHDYLVQVRGYVTTMKLNYGHDTPRAVLASGPWLVVFTAPVLTFVEGRVSAQHIVIFQMDDYVQRAQEMFNLLHRSVLARDVPFPLRSSQLRQYVEPTGVVAVFHGLHVHYEETGSPCYGPKPQVLVHPAIIIQRDDGVLVTVVDDPNGIPLGYSKLRALDDADSDQISLDAHLSAVSLGASAVLSACQAALGGAISPTPLGEFSGLPSGQVRAPELGPRLVAQLKGHQNDWIMVTGTATHYLVARPSIDPCQFHAWASGHAIGQGIGNSALSVRSIRPRASFVDTQIHHCANQVLQDRRLVRCHIMPIDERTCCQACVFAQGCWRADERADLPCGR